MPMPSFSYLKMRPRFLRLSTPDINFCISDEQYSVSVAKHNTEVDEALRLRFDVFNLELKEGLDSSYLTQKDEDQFDRQCDHLLIRELASNRVIGTYRLQTIEMAERGNGFYSDGEFKLDMLGKKFLRNGLELGRACIIKEFRNTRVLFLLWRGIANYIYLARKRYMFGCCSITSQDCVEGQVLYLDLIKKGLVDTQVKMEPQPGFELGVSEVPEIEPMEMPPLMKMYIRYGAKIVGSPAIDREFKTIDYFIVLDISKVERETFRLFLGK
jgi:putative hemolysin